MKKLLPFLSILLIFQLTNCKKKERIPWESTKKVYTNKLDTNTIAIDETIVNQITNYDTNTLELPLGVNIQELEVGKILFGQPNSTFEKGILRYVDAVDTVGNKIEITTSPAHPFMAFDDYKISEMDFGDYFTISSRDGGGNITCGPFNDAGSINIPGVQIGNNIELQVSFDWEANFDEFCYDEEELSSNTSGFGSVTTTTVLKKTKKQNGVYKIRNGKFQINHMYNGFLNRSGIDKGLLREFLGRPIKIPLGATMFNVELDIHFLLDIATQVESSVIFDFEGVYSMAIDYDETVEIQDIFTGMGQYSTHSFSSSLINRNVRSNYTNLIYNLKPSATIQINSKIGLEPRLSVSWFDSHLAAVSIGVEGYVEGQFNPNSCAINYGVVVKGLAHFFNNSTNLFAWTVWEKNWLQDMGFTNCDWISQLPNPNNPGKCKINFMSRKVSNAGFHGASIMVYRWAPNLNNGQGGFFTGGTYAGGSYVITSHGNLVFDKDDNRTVYFDNSFLYPGANWMFNNAGNTSGIYNTCTGYDPILSRDVYLDPGTYKVLIVDRKKYNNKTGFSPYFFSNLNINDFQTLQSESYGYGKSGYTGTVVFTITSADINQCKTIELYPSGNAILGAMGEAPYQ